MRGAAYDLFDYLPGSVPNSCWQIADRAATVIKTETPAFRVWALSCRIRSVWQDTTSGGEYV